MIDVKMLLMIFFINFAYITLNTLRFMLTMKGYRVIAPIVSMAEIIIYILGLSLVLNRLDNPINLLVYALGYAVGISVGIRIEDKLALGYIMVTVILPTNTEEQKNLPKILRENGYGVTVTYAQGLEGERLVLEILSSRKTERTLYRLIKEIEERAFIISYEPKYISGGFWTKKFGSVKKINNHKKIHVQRRVPLVRGFLDLLFQVN
jgi:uncharacterized protein YebE (UPF0316 family)